MSMLGIDLISNRLRHCLDNSIQVALGEQMGSLRIGSVARWSLTVVMCIGLGVTLTSCREEAVASSRSVALDQSWELDLGDVIEGFKIVAGLGDVSVHLRGARVRAPFDGEVQTAANEQNCVFFSSPEVPAYLFRFCGIKRPRIGLVERGESMGSADYLHFATLRRQPEGTWAIVEPSTYVLERSLERY
ncbi:hypothetical protein PN498_18395 [Oscillatoria sp. CS-180]|uniref:hypothetical protein n=1 Tax=Oscillatoria sp. CS-180 TaxID=3021720 RepID=UPI00232FBBD4|nr:hypothetical protein [Oscillatoria sp. CS-180]MDB9527970.1 hypothetical protein [Oscillatoria sp. CS-180]